MTLHAVTIPKWGLAMEEATLVAWRVPEGTAVTRGQEIAEIETSKIANALEASTSGVLRRYLAKVGETRAVGALLAVLVDGDEDDAAIDAFVAEFAARFSTAPRSVAAASVDQILIVDGRAINFVKVAGGESVQGAPLVLLHGLGGNAHGWLLNQCELAAGRDVYALDLAGHGASTKDVGGGTLEELSAGIDAFLGAQALGPVHLVGHSLGAAVALVLMLDRPDRVKSLTAIASPAFGGSINKSYLTGFLGATRRKELKPVIELLFAEPARVTREMVDELIAFKRIDGVPQALKLLVEHALSDETLARLRARLHEVHVPMLVIMGRDDRIVPPYPIENLPIGVRIMESAGHMPHLESAAELNHLIAEFVDRLD